MYAAACLTENSIPWEHNYSAENPPALPSTQSLHRISMGMGVGKVMNLVESFKNNVHDSVCEDLNICFSLCDFSFL